MISNSFKNELKTYYVPHSIWGILQCSLHPNGGKQAIEQLKSKRSDMPGGKRHYEEGQGQGKAGVDSM